MKKFFFKTDKKFLRNLKKTFRINFWKLRWKFRETFTETLESFRVLTPLTSNFKKEI